MIYSLFLNEGEVDLTALSLLGKLGQFISVRGKQMVLNFKKRECSGCNCRPLFCLSYLHPCVICSLYLMGQGHAGDR